jgi:hypothetical protein
MYSSYGGGGIYRTYGRYQQEEDDEDRSSLGAGSKTSSSSKKKINEMLAKALCEQDEEGEGDEAPEVLPAPSLAERGLEAGALSTAAEEKMVSSDDELENTYKQVQDKMDIEGQKAEPSSKSSAESMPISTSTRRVEEAKHEKARIAMEEEERRVAALTFDPDALLPFENMGERAKYIPLRLTYDERKGLRMVNAAINVSDYTNTVDVMFKKKAKRQHVQLQQIVGFLSGLVCCTGEAAGQDILEDRNFEQYEAMLRTKLEVCRRYKITNPEKLRSEYGKLVYLMQDAVSEDVRPLLGIDINEPIMTVYSVLEARGGLGLLSDPKLGTATAEILPEKGKKRAVIDLEIRRKNAAVKELTKKYVTSQLDEETLQLCLYSISDNNSFLNSNRRPILELRDLLIKYFEPSRFDPAYSLAIDEGAEGARLSHNHEVQYQYVMQSLNLWAAIIEDTFRLWYLSELDLLSESQPYELRDTGQGLQRVQQSPRVYKAMHEILYHTQQKLGSWVGSSVIHLGDNNVPNTLVFIDKYTQVSRILSPIVKTIQNLEKMCEEDEGLKGFLAFYGGIDKACKDILCDFFKHAFDGSGGDNFFDAGSCIDGRLTSAWNWCSLLQDKPYYPLFKLTGFLSFDGEFGK